MNGRRKVGALCAAGLGFVLAGCGATAPAGTASPPPSPTATAHASTAATAKPSTPVPSPTGSGLAAGPSRLVSVGQVGPPAASISVTVPPGWLSDGFTVGKAGMDVEPALGVWQISNRFNHPCTDHTLLSPPPGPGVKDLLDSLASQPGIRSGPITDVGIDGFSGKVVELTVATDIRTCGAGDQDFWLWASPDGDRRYVSNSTESNRIYALDIGGKRFTFFARIPAGLPAEDLATLETIIDSIDIEAMPSPSPSS